jgi:hypothetical protein
VSSPSIASRIARYDAALDRFERWLAERQNPDGSLRGENLPCNAYMPLPVYGQARGRHDLGERTWHFLERDYIRDGSLVQPEARCDMMPYTPAWFVMGAVLDERVGVRAVLQRDLLSYQDPRSGGFFASVAGRAAGSGIIDFDSTTQACAALCVAGLDEAAAKCGRFLRTLLEAQPDPARQLVLQWDTARGLVRTAEPGLEFTAVLVYGQRKAHLYKIGLLARALAFLAGTTGDRSYLELAESHFKRAVAASPDIWSNGLAHKMAWAAWTLFGLTADPYYADCGGRMADHLVSLQQADGGFHYPELWPDYAKAPPDGKVNLSAQFATWISYVRAMTAAPTRA